jgi:cbb3-type cytochrome oxidase subunit 3
MDFTDLQQINCLIAKGITILSIIFLAFLSYAYNFSKKTLYLQLSKVPI